MTTYSDLSDFSDSISIDKDEETDSLLIARLLRTANRKSTSVLEVDREISLSEKSGKNKSEFLSLSLPETSPVNNETEQLMSTSFPGTRKSMLPDMDRQIIKDILQDLRDFSQKSTSSSENEELTVKLKPNPSSSSNPNPTPDPNPDLHLLHTTITGILNDKKKKHSSTSSSEELMFVRIPGKRFIKNTYKAKPKNKTKSKVKVKTPKITFKEYFAEKYIKRGKNVTIKRTLSNLAINEKELVLFYNPDSDLLCGIKEPNREMIGIIYDIKFFNKFLSDILTFCQYKKKDPTSCSTSYRDIPYRYEFLHDPEKITMQIHVKVKENEFCYKVILYDDHTSAFIRLTEKQLITFIEKGLS